MHVSPSYEIQNMSNNISNRSSRREESNGENQRSIGACTRFHAPLEGGHAPLLSPTRGAWVIFNLHFRARFKFETCFELFSLIFKPF